MTLVYQASNPDPAALAQMSGTVLLEFGVDWCPHCQAAAAVIDAALAQRTSIRHLRVEDGRGRPLGRAYGVKLWPTLVLLRDGVEVGRLVRPVEAAAVTGLLADLDSGLDAKPDSRLNG